MKIILKKIIQPLHGATMQTHKKRARLPRRYSAQKKSGAENLHRFVLRFAIDSKIISLRTGERDGPF